MLLQYRCYHYGRGFCPDYNCCYAIIGTITIREFHGVVLSSQIQLWLFLLGGSFCKEAVVQVILHKPCTHDIFYC